ncbi:hypothetical protein B0T25DRAFT_492680 [Lasiosphaeria hispida]|uniref:Uncharacterized protein n=1 Tax=Lasiosphaeria hispida TaxID=260671 RepID=A0AAJ0HW51_9PEZI|nr:hypothetical protein B0T25DRAFT_492680 [Lasiosphaeria hispida]
MDALPAADGAALAEHVKKSESAEAGIQDDIPDINDGTDDDVNNNEQYLPFRSVRDFFARVNACTEETFLIVSPVSAAEYEAVSKSRERRGLKFRMDFWDGVELWVTVHASGVHEVLHRYLDDNIRDRIVLMGLGNNWKAVGSTTFNANRSGSEGDSSRKPPSQRRFPTAWPTLVIEGGYSQSMRKLRHKARWWLKTSNFEVKIVLLAKFLPISKTILVEKWVGAPAQASLPASLPNVTTRARQQLLNAQALVPSQVQAITIKPLPGVNPRQTPSPNSFQVVRSPLVLEFSLLFLRQPGPGEGDVFLGSQLFQNFAAAVWEEVE